MGKKDKKKEKKIKGAAKTAVKTEKNALKRMKKETASTGEDIDAVIASFQEEEKMRSKVVEAVTDSPSFRSGLSVCAHPEREELIFFGGEFFNGSKTTMYNELYMYSIKKDKWTKISCPNAPLPRCSHQAVMNPQLGGQMFVFGGEFSSPTHSQFRHYSDLWIFHISERVWEQVKASGGPSARSGHRMVLGQKKLFVFGGFHESVRDYKYFNDVHIFDLETRKWTKLDTVGLGPNPRSGSQVAALQDGRLLVYGGYSREKLKKDVDKGIVHSDMFLLQPEDFNKKSSSEEKEKPMKWKWVQVKQSGCRPTPRCGFSMTSLTPNNRAVFFGGVYDEENEESLNGNFYNDLYFLELETGKWSQVQLRGPALGSEVKTKRRRKVKVEGEMKVENENAENAEKDESSEDEAMQTLEPKVEKLTIEAKPAVAVTTEDEIFTVTIGPQNPNSEVEPSTSNPSISSHTSKAFVPHSRINAQLVSKNSILYLYGGTFEDGDRQLTLADFYSLDLHKLDQWQIIVPMDMKTQEWLESSSSEESDSSESDGNSDDKEGDDETDEDMEVEDK